MASWFERITRRFKRPSVADERVAPGTPVEQWTVPGVRFETAGWTLVDATPARMSEISGEPMRERTRRTW
jgi:hypothetical protein